MSEKWEVILTKSENEPWWFFDGWENNITTSYTFNNEEDARLQYTTLFERLNSEFDHVKNKDSSAAAFWNCGELLYCDSCGDDLQIFYGLIILFNKKPYLCLNDSHERELCK